jgi:fatty acid desaturase
MCVTLPPQFGFGYGVATHANPRRNACAKPRAAAFRGREAGYFVWAEDKRRPRGETVIWLLVLILLILAIGGGIALSKFLFVILIVALALALVGAFNRSAV